MQRIVSFEPSPEQDEFSSRWEQHHQHCHQCYHSPHLIYLSDDSSRILQQHPLHQQEPGHLSLQLHHSCHIFNNSVLGNIQHFIKVYQDIFKPSESEHAMLQFLWSTKLCILSSFKNLDLLSSSDVWFYCYNNRCHKANNCSKGTLVLHIVFM